MSDKAKYKSRDFIAKELDRINKDLYDDNLNINERMRACLVPIESMKTLFSLWGYKSRMHTERAVLISEWLAFLYIFLIINKCESLDEINAKEKLEADGYSFENVFNFLKGI